MTTFISYAREDLPLVRRLVDALKERNWDVWVDLEGIPFSAPWRAEIQAAIVEADAFVAVISPSFLASGVCAEELAYAVSSSKRLVPVVVDRTVSSNQVPDKLRELNWLYLDESAAFPAAIEQLDEVLRTDLVGARLHAGLLVQARRWEEQGGEKSLLLRGSELAEAEKWFADQTGTIPAPLPDHAQFLNASRREASRLSRIRTGIAVAVSVVLALATVFAFIQRNTAQEQRNLARQQLRTASARQLIAQAQIALPRDPRTALKLAEAAYQLDPGPETQAVLAEQLDGTRYRKQLGGFGDEVRELTFSPTGHILATASADGTVALWDVTDPARAARLGQPLVTGSSWSTTVAFSPNGTILAAEDSGNAVSLWDVRDPAHAVRIGRPLAQPGYARAVAFSRDDRTLAVIDAPNSLNNDDSRIVLWDVTDPARPALLDPPLAGASSTVTAVAFSPTSDLLAAADGNGSIVTWDVSAPSAPARLGESATPGRPTASLAFSPDGSTLAASGAESLTTGEVTVWDMRDGRRPVRLGSAGGIDVRSSSAASDAAIAPGGNVLVAAGHDGDVVLRRAGDPTVDAWVDETLAGHTDFDGGEGEKARASVTAVAFSPDGNTLASAGGDRTVILWDVRGASRPARVGPPPTGQTDALTAAAFRPGASVLVTGDSDGTTVLWDVRDPSGSVRIGHLPASRPTAVNNVNNVNEVAFSPDGSVMAIANIDGSVRVWDVRDLAKPPRPIGDPLLGYGESANAVAFSRDGRTLATADSDGETLLWDVSDLSRPIRELGPSLTSDIGAITTVDFSPTADILAAGTGGNVAMIWDVSDPARPVALGVPLTDHAELVAEVEFSPDGAVLAIADGGGRVILRAVADPARPVQIGQPLAASAPMAFSPDGAVLATSGADRTVDLWNVIDPTRPVRIGRPLAGHTKALNGMSFSADSTVLATASSDGTALLWRVPVENLRDPRPEACAVTDGGLDRTEWEREIPVLPWEESCP